MVKAVTDRLSMANGCEKKLREAAHDAPPSPLAQRWMRSLDRGDEVRTPPTGPGRGCEELQDEMGRLEQSVGESGWTR